MNISLDLIQKAIDWYSTDCVLSSVPYLVDPDIMEWTCPPGVVDRRMTHYNGKQYVASAEQSFLQLEKDGEIEPGTKPLIALTPCYRDEPILDETHFNIFLKLEIFDYNPRGPVDYSVFWAKRMSLFFLEFDLKTDIIQTDIGYDVMYGDLELGSFGERISPKGIPYVYGTGLAEPRASLALQRNSKKLLLSDSSVS